MDTKTTQRASRSSRLRRALAGLDQLLRLQREVLWHPRLGLVGARRPVPVPAPVRRIR